MIADIIETIDWIRAGIGGWRFILSPSYRRDTKLRWGRMKKRQAIWEVICGVAGVIFTFLILWLVWYIFTDLNSK